ncbi:MAG: sigma 54-interacting transcriptional regulator [Clostridiales Family XIII bacterium]|nr:sigma 54-interacting transcriptional regulator [Clostridiales Family XIII bacterium]
MLYRDIARPLREIAVMTPGARVADALTAIAGAGESCGRMIVLAATDAGAALITEHDLMRAIAANPQIVNGKLEDIDIIAAQTRGEEETVDLKDFGSSEALLVINGGGNPSGVVLRACAAEALYCGIAERLSEFAEKVHPLGGENYIGNEIFNAGGRHAAAGAGAPGGAAAPEAASASVGTEAGTPLAADALIAALADNYMKLWKILKYLADSIYVTDHEGVTIFANDAFSDTSAVKENEYLNTAVAELERQGHFKPAVTPMVIRERKNITIFQQVIDKNGRGVQWLVTGVPIFSADGELEMVVTSAKNIEEYEKLKRYAGKLKSSREGAAVYARDDLVSSGALMRTVLEMADKAAETDCTVMITGESGTGKGMLARYIHKNSARRKGSLVEVNCSSIPENLFESEFFGYETGAFTGAKAGGKQGLLEIAHGGTLLLDEIGDMSPQLQAKLLKVLQDKRLTRVGGLREIDVDVRIIASTNRSLPELIGTGAFREDLYYRLNLFPINIAPLRERREEIPMLTAHFLRVFNEKYEKQTSLSARFMNEMVEWSWPGNVRQLEYFVERMVILCNGEVELSDIPDGGAGGGLFGAPEGWGGGDEAGAVVVRKIIPLQEALDETERQLFRLAAKSGRSSYEIARILDTSQTNAYRKIKKYLEGDGAGEE